MIDEGLKEENKNLISLRTSLFATVVILTGGLAGLFLSDATGITKFIFLVIGGYLDFLLAVNAVEVNKIIIKNIGVMKNES